MNKVSTILIGFSHDFAAGCWAATVLSIYWLGQLSNNIEIQSALVPLKKDFFYLALICVGIVLLTGMGRTFTYIDNVYGEDSEKIRRKMLALKHILLFSVFGVGLYWQYSMVFNGGMF